jgi:hypothetical protein
MGIGGTINANLKGDCAVTQFCTSAGLDVGGFPEYLHSLVAQGHQLAALSNSDWEQIIGPMELPRERAARVGKAISELRMKAEHEANELNEKRMHNHIVNGGAHPMARPNAEVYEPKLNGARPTAADYQTFIPVAFFQGEKPGFEFKHGDQGLGYYGVARGGAGGASAAGPGTPATTGLVPRSSFNPISQEGLSDQMTATQQRAHAQSKQQQLLLDRRRRVEDAQQSGQHGYSQNEVASMYADARMRSSPFATGY